MSGWARGRQEILGMIERRELEQGQATYVDEQSVLDDLPKAEVVVDAVAQALPHLTVFTG
jgi:hypothetical protein